MMKGKHWRAASSHLLLPLLALVLCSPAQAGSQILATAGAGSIEGSSGGGINQWATLAGYGDQGEHGCTASHSRLPVDDYEFTSFGIACSLSNRLELSLARQTLDLGNLRPLLGLPGDQDLRMKVVGAKLRIAGDVLYRPYGQLSASVQYKQAEDGWLARVAGAERTHDVDVSLNHSKIFIDGPFGWMAFSNLGLRYSRANQGGLLGFGGDQRSAHRVNTELTLGLLPRRDLAFGLEYRSKPDNLGFAAEDDWSDFFVAWFPSKHLSIVAAWVDLGSIGGLDKQQGLFFTVTGGF